MTIPNSMHPEYLYYAPSWEKYRYVSEGGDEFTKRYLKRFSAREDTKDFEDRKDITPVPWFAGAAVTDVQNAIFERMSDITRKGGSKSYQDAVIGLNGGVDQRGSTMNCFIGRTVLSELLNMGKVGIYVDMPPIAPRSTISETNSLWPYLYTFRAEEIRNWVIKPTTDSRFIEFLMLLLEETTYTPDDEYGLPESELTIRYRLYAQTPTGVTVTVFNEDGAEISKTTLQIKRIPFVLVALNASLLKNIANHQISLLNLESSDIAYALKANYPFYTEQFDPRFDSPHLRDGVPAQDKSDISVGSLQGRKYPKDTERPDFINPSPEPLQASMEKQKNLKDDIRTIVNLAISNVRPRYASAESKELDERGLEAGLSSIGLVLEQAERMVGTIWSEYENTTDIPTIIYPERYSLKSDSERREEAIKLAELMFAVPSSRYSKEIAKRIAVVTLGPRVSNETLSTINKEIDEAQYLTADPKIIASDIEKALVDTKLASKARGYPEGSAELAQEDLAKRLAFIKASQTSGVNALPEEQVNPAEAAKKQKEDSQNTDTSVNAEKKVRGEAK